MKTLALFIALLFSISLQAQQWEKYSSGLIEGSIQCLAKDENNLFAGTQNQGVVISTDNGNNWTAINEGLVFNMQGIMSLAACGNNLLAGTDNGLYFSSNTGENWAGIDTNGLPTYNSESALVVNNNFCYYGANGAIFYSSDYGINWNFSVSGPQYSGILSFAFNNDELFLGTRFGTIYISKYLGQPWDSLTTLPGMISSLAVVNGKVIAGTSNGLYISSDEGLNWVANTNNLKDLIVTTIIYSQNIIFAGTNKGIFYSPNNGDDWVAFNEGLGDNNYAITLIVKDNLLFAGIVNDGIYRIDISAVSVNDKITNNDFEIYPNPTSDFISVSLKTSEVSEIQIYNMLGEKVLAVETGRDLSVRINISDLPIGMYFVKAGSETAKFVKM